MKLISIQRTNIKGELAYNFRDDWINNKLGIFASKEVTDAERQHLTKVLERAWQSSSVVNISYRLFRENIVRKDIEYPPLAILASKSFPTLRQCCHPSAQIDIFRIMKGGPKSVKGVDFDSCEKHEGDGRVTFVGAHPPEGTIQCFHFDNELGVPHEEYVSTLNHGDILNDPVVPKILTDLINKRK